MYSIMVARLVRGTSNLHFDKSTQHLSNGFLDLASKRPVKIPVNHRVHNMIQNIHPTQHQ